jgi:hypothetical protein
MKLMKIKNKTNSLRIYNDTRTGKKIKFLPLEVKELKKFIPQPGFEWIKEQKTKNKEEIKNELR